MKNSDINSNRIEDHINQCPDCSWKAVALDKMIDSLKDHKDAFCPEQWELYEYAASGEDPTGRISKHLVSCVRCNESVSDYRSTQHEESPLPPAFAKALDKRYPGHRDESSTTVSVASAANIPPDSHYEIAACRPPDEPPTLLKRISNFFSAFKFPIAAVAAAAAAAVLVVFMYPRGAVEIGPMVRLSTVSWGRIPGLTLMHGNKPKVGMVLSMSGTQSQLPQDRVDNLYKALQPSKEMNRHFSFPAPVEIKSAMGSGTLPSNPQDVVKMLRKELTLAAVLFINVESKGVRFDISTGLIDAKTGQTVGQIEEKSISEQDLAEKIKQAAKAVLEGNVPRE